jgi:hypothetical protein
MHGRDALRTALPAGVAPFIRKEARMYYDPTDPYAGGDGDGGGDDSGDDEVPYEGIPGTGWWEFISGAWRWVSDPKPVVPAA